MRARRFVADFGVRVALRSLSYLGVNAAAANTASNYSQGQREMGWGGTKQISVTKRNHILTAHFKK